MKAGQNHTLTVTRISDYGLYLADQEGQEVLLPNRYVSLADKVGDAVDVFVSVSYTHLTLPTILLV